MGVIEESCGVADYLGSVPYYLTLASVEALWNGGAPTKLVVLVYRETRLRHATLNYNAVEEVGGRLIDLEGLNLEHDLDDTVQN